MMNRDQVRQALRRWTEVFMHRSMAETRTFMETHGLSFAQISVLMHLRRADACRVSDLGARLGVSNAAASQLVDRLVQAGLVERLEDARDRRVKRLRLTPVGEALVNQAIAARKSWLESVLDRLSDEEQACVADALRLLTEAARSTDEGPSPR
ncbi:MAG TPA: MarR family transcriptional regulator [Anaerolineaceae bacterium]|nr:MarR family transcriptional regulator [Anaerolineaceae bacterium]